MIPFYGYSLNFAHGCIQTVVTAAVVTKNMHMSRRWKAELMIYGICKQTLPWSAHLPPLKPDCSPVYPICPESFQHLILTSKSRTYQTVHQNRPYD
jgi:hypothetical protein